MSSLAPDVSIVVPVYNEEDNILPLVDAIDSVMQRVKRSYEILVVDDGSSDRTWEKLAEARKRLPQLSIVSLRRNFGQTAALAAGFDAARGRHVVTMDGDLQNDPEDIPTFLALLDEGYDLVCGWRRDRKDRFLSRRLPSRVANALLSDLTGVRVHDFGCTLKGYRAAFVKQLPIYSEMHRYIPALAGSVGARVTEVVVRHHPRLHGKSKYGMTRVIRVLYDLAALRLLTRFAARPLHAFGVFSIPCFLIAGPWFLFTFFDHTTGEPIHYSTVVFPTVLFLLTYLGFHFLVVGLLAELAVNVLRTKSEMVVRVHEAAGGAA
ncbi:MAG: glycosyltransferase family 2 protein [Planctomycetes bacterium]|nr:glycosyltransferase family 2 protein [Planctomycetota bacterium]